MAKQIILTDDEWKFLKDILDWEEDHIYDYDYEYNCDAKTFYDKIKNARDYK